MTSARSVVLLLLVALGAGLAVAGTRSSGPAKATEESPYELVSGSLQIGADAGKAEAFLRGDGTVGAARIFPPDDRTLVGDSKSWPFRTIAELIFFDPADEPSHICTGTFVSQNVVLTAAHCLYYSGHFIASVIAVPAANPGVRPYSFAEAFVAAVPIGWKEGDGALQDTSLVTSPQFDYGIVIFEGDPFEGRLAPYPELAHFDAAYIAKQQPSLMTAGYPGDKLFLTMWTSQTAPVDFEFDDQWLLYRLDIFPGQSGSPIFMVAGRRTYVVSVIATSAPDANFSIRLLPIVLGFLRDTCRDLGCSLVTHELNADSELPVGLTPTPFPSPTKPPDGPAAANRPFRGVAPAVSRD